MAMNPNPDRNLSYMKEVWGTSSLITDYWSIPEKKSEKQMLREINNDEITPKKHDFSIQNEIHEKIRNDDDYDDWNYGTEPVYFQNL